MADAQNLLCFRSFVHRSSRIWNMCVIVSISSTLVSWRHATSLESPCNLQNGSRVMLRLEFYVGSHIKFIFEVERKFYGFIILLPLFHRL